MQQSVPSQSLGNLRIDETNVDSTQGGYSQTSFVHPVPYHLPRKSVLALLNSESEVDVIYPTFAKELAFRVKPIASLWDAFWRRSTEIR